ncbi:MAG: response regulator [Fibrobacterales bacterium]
MSIDVSAKNGNIKENNTCTILVADSNPENIRVVSHLLQTENYKIRIATSGEQVLSSVAEAVPDLILLDVQLTGIDGYEICRRLKSEPRSAMVPVLFISAVSETSNKVAAFKAGGQDYISLPYVAEEVIARVYTHIRLYTYQKELANKKDTLKLNSELEKRVLKRTGEIEAEKFFTDKVINSLPGIFYAFTPEGKLLRWNENYQKLIGLGDEKMKSIRAIESISEKDRKAVTQAIERAFTEGYAALEANVISHDLTEVPFYLTGSRVTIHNDSYLVGVGIDISDVKHAQKQLEKINNELQNQKDELEHFNETMIGREMRYIELKTEVNQLAEELNRELPYPPVWDNERELDKGSGESV